MGQQIVVSLGGALSLPECLLYQCVVVNRAVSIELYVSILKDPCQVVPTIA